MVLAFTGIYVIFDFFQLLGDIIRNHASAAVVLNYYRFLIPQVLFFPVLPLSVLVATSTVWRPKPTTPAYSSPTTTTTSSSHRWRAASRTTCYSRRPT